MAETPGRTRRQKLADLLLAASTVAVEAPGGGAGSRSRRQPVGVTFDGLRSELEIPVHVLEEDLGHLIKSLRGRGQRVDVDPAQCRSCGFLFRDRFPRHMHDPGRCPECASEAIQPARFWVKNA